MVDLRASFEVRTGALTTLERLSGALRKVGPISALIVDEQRVRLVEERWGGQDGLDVMTPTALGRLDGAWLLINGRCVLPPENLDGLAAGQVLRDRKSGRIVAASIDGAGADRICRGDVPDDLECIDDDSAGMLQYPWDVIRMRDRALERDLAARKRKIPEANPTGVTVIGEAGLHTAADATILPGVVLDAGKGAIVIESGAVVRPGAIICGPCWVGRNATVLDQTLLKGGSAIGPWCKVAGEVGGTIFQGYSNKAHAGHLGDAWVGEWSNLGAGTTNSNLLNTYGEVVMQTERDGRRHRTGLQFLGCIIADHVKFAINTRIMTGSVFGTGAMVATTAAPPALVEPFAWLTDAGASRFRLSKFIDVARTVMARRRVEFSAAYEARLTEVFGGIDS